MLSRASKPDAQPGLEASLLNRPRLVANAPEAVIPGSCSFRKANAHETNLRDPERYPRLLRRAARKVPNRHWFKLAFVVVIQNA